MLARRLLALTGLALIAGGVLWLAFLSGSDPTRPAAGDRVIAFGDSLVQGVGASPGRDFVSILSRRLGVPIENAGRSGDTTASALVRLDRDVLNRRPRVVVVLLGGNDMLRRVPRRETFRNLEAIVSRIRERGAAVVLLGVEVSVFTMAYGWDYEALAERTSATLIPDILDGVLGRQDLMADGIHPNDRGYEVIAGKVEPVLRRMIE
jgi:lysophospholipase L1-like esterase